MMRRISIVLLMLITTVFLVRAQLLGMILDPMIEKSLTKFFDMPIIVDSLSADPITGDVKIGRFRFMNQPEFSPRPHIDILGLKTQVHVRGLFRKQVLIETIWIDRLDYWIEREISNGQPLSNCKQMARAVKRFRKLKKEAKEKELAAKGLKEDPNPGQSWFIHISDVLFADGSFRYQSWIEGKPASDYFFHDLEGGLSDIRYPNDANLMNQSVKVEGLFGTLHPTPFQASGKANFINSLISFDLKGRIEEGPIEEYNRVFEEMQLEPRGGTFDLEIHSVCKLDRLKENNKLTLKSIRLASPGNVMDKLWGIPRLAAIKFLETEKNIVLNIPLEGDVSDPQFDFPVAFRAAFQEALRHHTVSGFTFFKDGSVKLASETQKLAEAAAGKMGQVTEIVVKAPAEAAIEKVLPLVRTESQQELSQHETNPPDLSGTAPAVKT